MIPKVSPWNKVPLNYNRNLHTVHEIDMPMVEEQPGSTRPGLPPAFVNSAAQISLHFQGAEALLYKTYYLGFPGEVSASQSSSSPRALPAALKYRPSKPYRHPILDAKLTRHRILQEARILVKLRQDLGPYVPAVYALDWDEGWIMQEWIDGQPVRSVLDDFLPAWLARREQSEQHSPQGDDPMVKLMHRMGRLVGKIHESGVVHGDLTTSNIMLRKHADAQDSLEGELVAIDFGLAAQSVQDEGRAVDLYVLEKAFGSTHPKTEDLFGELLQEYGKTYNGAKVVLKRFKDVRLRGRKKIMIG